MVANPIVYKDRPGQRVLDLQSFGVDCIPVLGLSNFRMIHPGTDYHIHPGCVEICLCVRGNLAFETKDRTYSFLPNSVFVSTADEPHRMRHNPKGLLVYRILFAVPHPGKRILGLSARETEWIARSLTHLPKRLFKSTPQIKAAFDELFATYDSDGLAAARAVRMKSAALALLVAVIKAARLLPPKAPNVIAALMKRMCEHPDCDYPVGKLAAEASLSESAFSETFKRAAGLPPHAYLLSCRINRAQKMLSKGRMSIKAIANRLRFTSSQHFSTAFMRIVGTTPARYQSSGNRLKPDSIESAIPKDPG